MQRAIYNNHLTLIQSGQTVGTETVKPGTSKPGTGLVRRIARRWDLVGVLALMGSSAAYAVYALMHLGL